MSSSIPYGNIRRNYIHIENQPLLNHLLHSLTQLLSKFWISSYLAHLSQPWDTIVRMPKPSVNSLLCQEPVAGGLKYLSPTHTSAHSTETAPVQSLENATIPLLPSAPAVITWSGCQSKPPPKFADSAHYFVLDFISTYSPQEPQTFQHLLHPDVESQSTPHPFALARKHIYGIIGSDPDTMRLHEEMKEPDRLQFLAAMQKEIEDHVLRKHRKVTPLHSLPPNNWPYHG